MFQSNSKVYDSFTTKGIMKIMNQNSTSIFLLATFFTTAGNRSDAFFPFAIIWRIKVEYKGWNFLKISHLKKNINSTYVKYLEDKLQKQISYRVNKQLFLSHLIYSNYLRQRTNNLLGININTHRHIKEETVI